MQSKKKLFYLTLTLSLLSLVASVLLFLWHTYSAVPVASLLYSLSLGLFSSSLLGCTMSLTEYFVAKKEAMETFYEEAAKVLLALKGIQYFDIDAPVDLVQACFGEEQKNNSILGASKFVLDRSEKDRLCGWYLSTLPENVRNSSRFQDDWSPEDWYQEKMKEYDDRLEKCFDSIIALGDLDFSPLQKSYGNLDFFRNKKWREGQVTPIYQRMVQAKKLAEEKAFHFKICKESPNGNKFVNIWFLMLAYQEWFTATEHPQGEMVKTMIYFTLTDELTGQLESYRSSIYGQTPEATSPQPVCSLIKTPYAQEPPPVCIPPTAQL